MTNSWLKNERLSLRSPEPEDLELLYQMENDTRLWCVGCNTLPYSRHTLRAYLQQSQQDLYSEHQARFIITLHNGENTGMIDLIDFDPHNSRAEVCIGLLEKYRHQGIAKEALELLSSYALNFLHLHQVYAYIPIDNFDSIALFESCNFKKTATLKDWITSAEKHKDVVFLQLIRG